MTTFIYFLVYVLVAGFFGLFMLVLTAGSLMEQEKRFKALEEKIDKDYEKIIIKNYSKF